MVRRPRLQLLHRHRRHRLPPRRHAVEGVRRARVVCRPLADDRLGRLPPRLPGDDLEAQGAPHLRGELVLSRLHRHDRDAAYRQQPGDAGVVLRLEVVPDLRRRAGRARAVVVRPQRRRLFPHRRLPRHHVLLHPEAGRAADLFVPAIDHPLLGPDLHVHLGGPAPPALHGAARLGPDARHDLLDHAAGCPRGAA